MKYRIEAYSKNIIKCSIYLLFEIQFITYQFSVYQYFGGLIEKLSRATCDSQGVACESHGCVIRSYNINIDIGLQ